MVANNPSADCTPLAAFKAGCYRHYKGNLYQVIDLVRHSETEEWLVLYRPDYGDKKLWVRPFQMFFEQIEVDGDTKPRFEYIENLSG
ncbi:MAG: DUF1653 domain-containing protein [Enterobacterales bacterium]|nr:DUF1653 domain-containing protein [Enterobacterales bacterium]